jgi:predicted DNA-binding protein
MQRDTSYITSIRFPEKEAELLMALAKKREWSISKTVREAVRSAAAAAEKGSVAA